MHPKLYVLTRADLSPGAQATQSAHAAFQFAIEHPQLTEEWYRNSQYLILLSVPDEEALMGWVLNLQDEGLVHSVFHEPDWEDQLTAIAVAPSETAQRIFANLPLTLREASLV